MLRCAPGEAGGWRQPLDEDLTRSLTVARERVASPGHRRCAAATRTAARRGRALEAGSHLTTDLDAVLTLAEGQVAWVEGPEHAPVLEVAPLDVGALLAQLWWGQEDAPTAVLTSATIPPRLGERLGLDRRSYDELDVGSPFDYAKQALLYCAAPPARPPPREPTRPPCTTSWWR